MMATTAELSEWTRTWVDCHAWPHTATAITMGISSFTMMWYCGNNSGHCSWNQWDFQNAPQPHLPDASDITLEEGWLLSHSKDTPFHFSKNKYHHSRSLLKLWFKRMWWWGCVTTVERLIIWLKNTLPSLTTLQAWLNWPIRERNSHFVQFLEPLQHLIVSFNRSNLSYGRHISIFMLSSLIP